MLQIAHKSTCEKLRFGAAALSQEGQILALGYNHNPLPMKDWTCKVDCVGDLRKGIKSGTQVERCFSLHAEQHAILQVARIPIFEIAVAGLWPDDSLFDNGGGFYCTVCARLMAAVGVHYVTIWTLGQPQRITMQQAWDQSYGLLRF